MKKTKAVGYTMVQYNLSSLFCKYQYLVLFSLIHLCKTISLLYTTYNLAGKPIPLPEDE